MLGVLATAVRHPWMGDVQSSWPWKLLLHQELLVVSLISSFEALTYFRGGPNGQMGCWEWYPNNEMLA